MQQPLIHHQIDVTNIVGQIRDLCSLSTSLEQYETFDIIKTSSCPCIYLSVVSSFPQTLFQSNLTSANSAAPLRFYRLRCPSPMSPQYGEMLLLRLIQLRLSLLKAWQRWHVCSLLRKLSISNSTIFWIVASLIPWRHVWEAGVERSP